MFTCTKDYEMEVGQNWGTMPEDLKMHWISMHCHRILETSRAIASTPSDDKCFDLDSELQSMRPPPSNRDHKRWILTVVIPFALHQLISLKVSLWSWQTLFPPCSKTSTLSSSINLMFYSNVPLTPAISRSILELSEPFRRCFGFISFADANINPQLDADEQFSEMFYKLWGPERHMFLDPKETNVLFFMETNTRPVRALWLEKIYLESKMPDFWIRGSAPQYPISSSETTLAEPMHINRNALYRHV